MNSDINKSKNNLADTKAGAEWLKQFDAEDIETAHLLLDSLVFVSNKELVDGIKKCIDTFLDNHEGKVAIYAVREVPENTKKYWQVKKQFQSIKEVFRYNKTAEIKEQLKIKYTELIDAAKNMSMYFENKICPPKQVDASPKGGIGSEGPFANLCRDICADNTRLLNHPSLCEMQDSRCNWILCLDDIIASGKRMEEFSKWLDMHKTIKSWRSFGWLNFASISYAVSETGLSRLKESIVKEKQYCRYMRPGRTFWTNTQFENIIKLCKKYGKITSRKKMSCGFREAMTLIVFEHKCPNTAPSILWSPPSNKWKSIFDGRPSIVLKKWPKANKTRNQKRILKALGQTRLYKPSFFDLLDENSRQLLVLLAALAMKKRRVTILSDILELPHQVITKMLKICYQYGWINDKMCLTNSGHKTLTAAKKNNCLSSYEIILKDNFYYPKALKGSANSFSSGSLRRELP